MIQLPLQGSVGLGGTNLAADVRLVQELLNAVPSYQGGPMPLLAVDGIAGPMTAGAIGRFQLVRQGFKDGRLDPGHGTERALVELLLLLGLLMQILSKIPGTVPPPEKPIPQPKPPQTVPPSGLSPIRAFFMEQMEKYAPANGLPVLGTVPENAGKATGCGGLPGRVFRNKGVPRGWGSKSQGPDDFVVLNGIDDKGRVLLPTFRLSDPTIGWEYGGRAVNRDFAPVQAWIPFKPDGPRPKPGDIYIQKFTHGPFTGSNSDKGPGYFAHVGIVISCRGEEFVTGDGGQQPNGFSSKRNTRRLFADGACETGPNVPGRRLAGWVDLDAIWGVYEANTSKGAASAPLMPTVQTAARQGFMGLSAW